MFRFSFVFLLCVLSFTLPTAFAQQSASRVSPQEGLQRALDEASQRVAKNPRDAEAFIRRGELRSIINDFAGARSDFEKAIQITPKSAEAYRGRGFISLITNDAKSALADFEKALELAAPNAKVQVSPTRFISLRHSIMFQRSSARSKLGDIEGAMRDLDEVIAENPDDAGSYLNRANLYKDKKDYNRALADLDRAIELSPDMPFMYMARADVRRQQGDIEGAQADLARVAKSGANPNTINSISVTRRVRVDAEGKTVETTDNNPNAKIALAREIKSIALTTRGANEAQRADLQAALLEYDKAIKLDKRNYDAYLNRAGVWRDLGNAERALADYNQAVVINPRLPFALFGRGKVLWTLGRRDEATRDFDACLKLDPTFATDINRFKSVN